MINILCTSRPADGLFCYSYEYCNYLNSIGITSQVVVITHPKSKQKDYIESINEKYIVYENVVFDYYIPEQNDICLIMGRSMLTLPYLNKSDYTKDQLLTIRSLVSKDLISVYSENHPKEYPLALLYFSVGMVYDLYDDIVYPDGDGQYFEKMINFSIYKPVIENVKYKYLFLGTNKEYYAEVEKQLDKFDNYVILVYDEKYINPKHNHIFAPVRNLLGLFDTYVYTKNYFDPAPRLIQECKWLGKDIIYLRDKNIKDGGPVYYQRPVPTMKLFKNSSAILIGVIKEIYDKDINRIGVFHMNRSKKWM